MNILPTTLKKLLPLYLAIELIFIVGIVFYSLPLYVMYVGQSISDFSLKGNMLGIAPINKTKLIYLQYYGEAFDIETDTETFGELVATLPFDVEKEYLDKLGSLELFNFMSIMIPPNQYQSGTASWYGSYFHGLPTASTEPYDMYALTAAHKTLPLGTSVKVTNIENRKSVIVRINDRGPFVGERIIDLSWEAARQLNIIDRGLVSVIVEIIE